MLQLRVWYRLVIIFENRHSVLFSPAFLAEAMRALIWIVIFFIAMIFALLKRNVDGWSLHNPCVSIWSILLEIFIIICLYTKNSITTKRIIEIVAMYQTAFAMVALDIVIGLLITYIHGCYLSYTIFIC